MGMDSGSGRTKRGTVGTRDGMGGGQKGTGEKNANDRIGRHQSSDQKQNAHNFLTH